MTACHSSPPAPYRDPLTPPRRSHAPNANERSDSLDHYFREIATFEPLTMAEEVALSERIQDGDQDALETLVRANLRFVVSVAMRYREHGVALADLINEGNLGLLRGASRYDGTRGVRFITYAVWWIRQAIFRIVAEQGRPVCIPPNRAGTMYRIGRRATALRRTLGREATHAEIAAAADVSEDEVATAAIVSRNHLSLDAPLSSSTGTRLIDHLVDDGSPTPDARTMESALTEVIEASVSTLPEREATVVRLYFGLDGEGPRTLEQIGTLFGVTRERVRQIKGSALAKLRDGRPGAMLAQFY